MMETLRQYLKTFNLFTDNELEEALAFFSPVELKPNEYFIQSGQVCHKLAFVVSGLLRNYYLSSREEEVTYCLTFANTFATAYSSFLTGQPTFENIHAVSNTQLLVIGRESFNKLIDSGINWLMLSKILAEKTYLEMETRLLTLQMESAEKRYFDLLSNRPELLQQVPLKYLASYLGITQRHLSRLRRNVSF